MTNNTETVVAVLHWKPWLMLAMALGVASCGGGGHQMPLPDGDIVIVEEAVPQSYPVDAPVFVQMAPRKPIDLTMTAGNSLTMKVTVKGSPYLVYTWRYKGWIIEGQSSDTYTIPSVQAVPAGQSGQPGQEGSYTVTITNSTSVATSSFVNLKVIPRGAPAPTGP